MLLMRGNGYGCEWGTEKEDENELEDGNRNNESIHFSNLFLRSLCCCGLRMVTEKNITYVPREETVF